VRRFESKNSFSKCIFARITLREGAITPKTSYD